MLQARVELSKSNLRHNISGFQNLLRNTNPNGYFCAVVKSNAYGHGLKEIVSMSGEMGVDVYGVNSPEEAKVIRSLDSQIPILIMGDIPELFSRQDELQDPNFWILVSRLDEWEFLSNLPTRPKIHIKVDTGMGRLGSYGMELESILKSGAERNLPLEGIATHFASTEDLTEHSYSQMQLTRFKDSIALAERYGYKNLIRHASASASALLFDEARLDMIRVGISLYGLWPSIETKLSMKLMDKESIELKPVLSWKTKIQHIRDIPTGSYIGYGSTYKTTYPTRLGVVPVGYYEGLDRKLSNSGYMLIQGERARVLGRVCMNMTMLDITHIPNVKLGDEVVIIGESNGEVLGADTISSWTHTINYETVTKILPHFPRYTID